MKIDRTKLKKSSSEVPADCKSLIEKLKGCGQELFLQELRGIETWTYGELLLRSFMAFFVTEVGVTQMLVSRKVPRNRS